VHGTASLVCWTVGETAGSCWGGSSFSPDGVSDFSSLAVDSFARYLSLSLSRLPDEPGAGRAPRRRAGVWARSRQRAATAVRLRV